MPGGACQDAERDAEPATAIGERERGPHAVAVIAFARLAHAVGIRRTCRDSIERPPTYPCDLVRITSALDELPPDRGPPGPDRACREATGYRIHVKPLRYRERPHLSAWTDFSEHSITLQVPEPFFPFGEVVPYGAKRRPGPHDPLHLADRGRHVPHAARGAPVPVLPRVDALVPARAARPEVRGRDHVRSVRAAELPAARGDDGGRARRRSAATTGS